MNQQTDNHELLRILVVEDNPVFQKLIFSAIEKLAQKSDVCFADTGGQALTIFGQSGKDFDLVLVDLGLPDIDGIDVIANFHLRSPKTPIMVISTMASDQSVLAAIQAGVSGYFLKSNSVDSISIAISEVLDGNYPISPSLARTLFKLAGAPELIQDKSQLAEIHLSPRETETLKFISCGHSYKEVADLMGVSLSTIQYYVRNIYRKLDSNNQMQAVSKARDIGLI